jgi:hypothetical protein
MQASPGLIVEPSLLFEYVPLTQTAVEPPSDPPPLELPLEPLLLDPPLDPLVEPLLDPLLDPLLEPPLDPVAPASGALAPEEVEPPELLDAVDVPPLPPGTGPAPPVVP